VRQAHLCGLYVAYRSDITYIFICKYITDVPLSPQKDWKRSLRQKRKLTNPVRTGFEFVEYLNKNPVATYDDLSVDAGITKARVCQMIALCKRLPPEITDYLINTDEPEILKHFTERRLRPLTLLESDEDKIKKFDEMKGISKG
jgi:hypothetical protein